IPGIRRKLKVVLDTMGGAFSEIAPHVLSSVGYDIIPIRSTIDPDFEEYTPNPAIDTNLQMLRERVIEEQADLGIALDGDGDRVIFMDGTGRIVRPEQIGVLLIQRCFDRPLVVYDQKCASVLADAAEAAGGSIIIQPSGHGFIKTTMIEKEADLGIEISGHHFYKALGGGDDGLLTALLVTYIVTVSGSPLADLIEPIGWPDITPDLRIAIADDVNSVLERIASRCGGRISRIDGIRVQYEDGWALARASITEPVITLRFEGRDSGKVKEIASRFLVAVPELADKVMEMIDG
ncbi:MAG: phosphomannomutase/phosphoglucomutase, partial [Planctomycetota bacterium]